MGRPRGSLWRRFGPFTSLGFVLIVVGALGLASDMTLPWSSNTAERTVPILGVVNEGAPWVDQYRDDLIEVYRDSSFYAQGFLLWNFLGWAVSIVAGAVLVLTSVLRRVPRVRTTVRTITLCIHLGLVHMMLFTVSRRLGRQFLDRRYNGIDYYAWEATVYIQAVGGLILAGISAYLLWRLYQERPVLPGRTMDAHVRAVSLHLFAIGLFVVTMVVSPWVPWGELVRRAIIGNAWLGEGNLISYARINSAEAVVVAGQAWIGALRALYVATGLSALSILGIIWWRHAHGRIGRLLGALLANAYVVAIGPLALGANAYDIYVRIIARQDNHILLNNQFHGLLLSGLMLVWVAHLMMVTLPVVRSMRHERAGTTMASATGIVAADPTP